MERSEIRGVLRLVPGAFLDYAPQRFIQATHLSNRVVLLKL
jgi:hypothetical protein